MGWKPVGGSSAHDHDSDYAALDHSHVGGSVTAKEAVDDAATKTVYPNGGSAVYDAVSNRTYIAYLGLDRDLFVTHYDHQAGTFATPVSADTRLIDVDDNHPSPSIDIDLDGHLHIAWASHNTSHRHVKSDNPYDISAWTGQTLSGDGTYPCLRVDPSSGNIYIIDRAGDATSHTSPYPSHAYGSMYKSTNGGTSFTRTQIVDTTSLATATDFYPLFGARFHGGYLHMVWTVAQQASGHDGSRTNVYHAKLDPTDDTWYTADGTSLGSGIVGAEHTSCLVATDADLVSGNFALHGDYIAITFLEPESGDRAHHVAVWDGSSWTVTATGIDAWDVVGLGMPFYSDGALRGLFCVDDAGSHGNVELYGALADGSEWTSIATVLEGASGEGYVRVSPVIGDGPSIALAMEAPTGNADTNATAPDLLPVQLILTGGDVEAHAASHADGGADEIDAADLSSGAASDGHVLTADGSGGAAWEAPSGGGGSGAMTLIESVEVSGSAAANIDFSSVSGSYNALRIVLLGRSNRSGSGQDSARIQVGNTSLDTGSNYDSISQDTSESSGGSSDLVNMADGGTYGHVGRFSIPAATATTNLPGMLVIDIPEYAATTFHKVIHAYGGFVDGTTNQRMAQSVAVWQSTAAIDEIRLSLVNGSWVVGTTARLYGIT